MSRSVRIVQRARADVDDIFNWLVGRSIQGAVSRYLAFGQTVDQIRASPESFAAAPESLPLGRELRQALFKTRRGRLYRIVFQFDTSEVVILRVRGPAQAALHSRDVQDD